MTQPHPTSFISYHERKMDTYINIIKQKISMTAISYLIYIYIHTHTYI